MFVLQNHGCKPAASVQPRRAQAAMAAGSVVGRAAGFAFRHEVALAKRVGLVFLEEQDWALLVLAAGSLP